MAQFKATIYWFRKALRIHDNPALVEAIQNSQRLYPIFVLDPWFRQHAKVGVNRWRFLRDCLSDLDTNLQSIGLRLFVVKNAPPEEALPLLIKKWNIDCLAYEYDMEPYALERDSRVERLARELNVRDFIVRVSHTLYDPRKVIIANNNRAPITYQHFLSTTRKVGPVPQPLEAPSLQTTAECCKHMATEYDQSVYGVPTLHEMGVEDESQLGPHRYVGGETQALRRMHDKLKDVEWVCKFEKPKTSPNSLEPATTVLSPYLKMGCLSSRCLYYAIDGVYKKSGGHHTQPPVSLLGQLLFREFFYTVAADTPNFDRMEGNRICKQIPWDTNDEYFQAWRDARTGYPFIDAAMRQLRQEGWIHHLARHSVACFLTRGDLYLSWELGKDVFEELLIDADWAVNAANWMWLSASAFFNAFFRVYSPVAFGKKTDKNGEYIRLYVPELKNYSNQFIYEPWKAPVAMQRAWGCIIGTDYPKPIVEHDRMRLINIARHQKAYKENRDRGGPSTSNYAVGKQQDDGIEPDGDVASNGQENEPSKKRKSGG